MTKLELIQLVQTDIGCSEGDLITDLNANTPQAKKMNRLFEAAVSEVQSSFRWNELTVTAELTPVDTDAGDENELGLPNKYDLPPDFLRLAEFDTPADLLQQGMNIYSSSNPLKVTYIRRNANPESWSAELTSVVRAKLRLDAYVPLSDDDATRQAHLEEYLMITKPLAERVNSYDKRKPARKYTSERGMSYRNLRRGWSA